uniref:UDP-glucuronosyltransferase n=1 Tax=Photinus pyralis TaxID=7054 RepID=A0A1Y1NNN5_PHOPY
MFACVAVISFAVLLGVGDSAKILGVVPTPSISHQVVFQPFFRELSLRGHEVTALTTDPMRDPKLSNLTEIDLHFSYRIWNEHIMKNALKFKTNPIGATIDFYKSTIDIQDEQLRHPSVQALIRGEEKFDLIIIESIMPALFGFVHKFKCPYIMMFSQEAPSDYYKLMGNPTHPILYPDAIFQYDQQLPFPQRLLAVLTMPLFPLFARYIFSMHDHLVQNHFGDDYPSIVELMSKPDMLFVHTDQIFHKVRPLVPTVIQIGGGSHMRPIKPLPSELKNKLDNAEHGFVYFSLGSNVKSKDLPPELLDTILSTFAELPYTILWKFEGAHLDGLSDNVITSPWLPQQDVLRHPNIKLFITQGGLQSLEEAMYSGVPILGVPFYGDQTGNVKRMEIGGTGLIVDYATVTKDEFKAKILEVAQNTRFRNKAKELAALAQDQPMTGLERAVWWTEYVIRHKGASHLRSPLLDVPWYQYLLLDVLAVIASVMVIVGLLVFYIVRWFIGLLTCRRKKNEKKIQ